MKYRGNHRGHYKLFLLCAMHWIRESSSSMTLCSVGNLSLPVFLSTVKNFSPSRTLYTTLALLPYVGSSASDAVTFITDVPVREKVIVSKQWGIVELRNLWARPELPQTDNESQKKATCVCVRCAFVHFTALWVLFQNQFRVNRLFQPFIGRQAVFVSWKKTWKLITTFSLQRLMEASEMLQQTVITTTYGGKPFPKAVAFPWWKTPCFEGKGFLAAMAPQGRRVSRHPLAGHR